MKLYLSFVSILAIFQGSLARFNIICHYDTLSVQRGGFANFTETDLKNSFEYCTHIIYGHVGLRPRTFDIETLHPEQHLQFTQVKKLKKQYRHIKFLLSLGGDKDIKNSEKYIKLLEANEHSQDNFVRSAASFVQKYSFDGFDLAYQFPHNQLKQQSKVTQVYEKAKNILKNNLANLQKKVGDSSYIVVYKHQFSALANRLRNTLRRQKLMLTLTVLPHVNASVYLNIPAIVENFDFVNLGTFDYSTPERTPHKADFLAPLQAPPRHNARTPIPPLSVNSELRQWLSHHVNAGKLNIGVAAYGRAWKMTKELKSSVMPISSSLGGPAQGGELTHTPGLLSWPELCFRLKKMSKTKDKMYGNYAYRSANVKGHEGIFVTYEDQDSLGAKAEFVESNSLGGVAIFDITLDDFRGKCKEGKFPALKAIKFKLH